MLSNEFIAGRKIENQFCARQGKMIAGRSRSPDILTYLNAEMYPLTSTEKRRLSRNTNSISGKKQIGIIQILSRSKPTLLVEFAVVGKVSLRNESQEIAFLYNGSTIEEQVSTNHRKSHNGNNI